VSVLHDNPHHAVGWTVRPMLPRLLVFIVAYNAERTIENVLTRIPTELLAEYDLEVLVIDDSSQDHTFERGEVMRRSATLPFRLHVLLNPVNQGYGGNQKIGFHFAIQKGFDYVALVHGDGQYAPECLPELIRPLRDGEADAVLGSRMLRKHAARVGGMPAYKFIGNKILTRFQNALLHAGLSEFHSGYRVYSTASLRKLSFDLNTNDFHFDTEIIIQLLFARLRIVEVPIPTYYGDEICHVNGLRYAARVARTTIKARIQELGLLYDRKFDLQQESRGNEHYESKLGYDSPHALTLSLVEAGSRVLDLGCAGGYLGSELRRRGCHVVGVDVFPLAEGVSLDDFHHHDLNSGLPNIALDEFDYVLLLDVIEHLRSPEVFVAELYAALRLAPHVSVVLSTGNVAFAMPRLLLLAGQFNYGKRGILDLTHSRLFTFSTLCRLLEGAGFILREVRGVPAPFPLALGSSRTAHALVKANALGSRLWKRLFAYQIFVVAQPRPSLDLLLQEAYVESKERSGAIADS
jgi:glycosyltransferase involved in cell wall biosynthesis